MYIDQLIIFDYAIIFYYPFIDLYYQFGLFIYLLIYRNKGAWIEMYCQVILTIVVNVQIGHVVCAAYPLAKFDTIDPRSGELDSRSALNLIVFGVMGGLELQLVPKVSKISAFMAKNGIINF